MKKLTDENANELLAVIATDFIRPEEIKKTWRAAGLLEPEEDALEKARREYIDADIYYPHKCNEKYIEAIKAERYIRELKHELTRLKASAWTDEDMRKAYDFGNQRAYKLMGIGFDDWLKTQRRVGKGAER